MRGRWWGLAVLLAATTLAVSANPTSRASSSADSVTIPLILRQPGAKQTPKKVEPPKKEEPKSPQDILEEAKPTPVAMQSADVPPSVPLLEAPPAPTLDPALPTTPELFVPDLVGPLPPPKPQVAEPKPQPKKLVPALVTPPESKAQPALNPEPKHPTPLPREKPRAAVMEPVDDVKPESLRKFRDAKSPALAPQEDSPTPPPVEVQPVEDKLGSLRAAPDGKPPSFRCRVRDVMAFSDRTHVRCHNKIQGVSTFAVNTDQPVAETVMTKALAAMKSGKPITIAFAPDVDLNPPNCGGKDCRRLIDIEN